MFAVRPSAPTLRGTRALLEMDVYVGKLMNLDALCKLMCTSGGSACVCECAGVHVHA